jgi:hypothetical protein
MDSVAAVVAQVALDKRPHLAALLEMAAQAQRHLLVVRP